MAYEYNGFDYIHKLKRRKKTDYIVVHHSAGGWGIAGHIHLWHLNRGFSGGGYNLVIENGFQNYSSRERNVSNGVAGLITDLRPKWAQGAHCRGFNARSVGICVIGNYSQEKMPDIIWESLIDLVYDLCLEYKLDESRVIGHRESYVMLGKPVEKQCPGTFVSMELLRETIATRLNPNPNPPPEELTITPKSPPLTEKPIPVIEDEGLLAVILGFFGRLFRGEL